MARAPLITLSDEVHHILIRWWERQILGEHGLDVLRGNDLPVALVEQTEALFRLFVLASLGADALVPVVCDDMLDKCEVNSVTFQEIWITLLELLLDLTRCHLVEAEVLNDVFEEVVGDGEFALFKIVVEALLEISGHLTGQVASSKLSTEFRRLGDSLFLLVLGCGFLRVHFL